MKIRELNLVGLDIRQDIAFDAITAFVQNF